MAGHSRVRRTASLPFALCPACPLHDVRAGLGQFAVVASLAFGLAEAVLSWQLCAFGASGLRNTAPRIGSDLASVIFCQRIPCNSFSLASFGILLLLLLAGPIRERLIGGKTLRAVRFP